MLALPAVLAAAPAAAAAAPAEHPDAALIARCDAYIATVRAFNVVGRPFGDVEPEDDPLWHQLEAAKTALNEAPIPTTLAGVLALARVAQAEARKPSGRFDFQSEPACDHAERVVLGLLRVAGEGVA